MKKKVLFIVNPVAGRKRTVTVERKIQRYLDFSEWDYTFVYTRYKGHGKKRAEQAVEANYDVVVVAGGDGSVNEVLQGLYGSSVTLAILPLGSGNGIARSLKIPLRLNTSIGLLQTGRPREIDVGSANGRLFLGTAGVGFDALITRKFEGRKRRGLWSYLNLIVSHVGSYKSVDWRIEIDGKSRKMKAFMITAANAPQLGYNFFWAPEAKMTDGHFRIIQVYASSFWARICIGVRAFTKSLNNGKNVKMEAARTLRIHKNGKFFIQLDGEAMPCHSSVEIKMMPKRLKVLSGNGFDKDYK